MSKGVVFRRGRRYEAGMKVWVRGWSREPALVLSAQTDAWGWPTYDLMDDEGHVWTVPRLYCSTRPLGDLVR